MRKEMEEKIFQSTEVDAILLTSPANMRFVAAGKKWLSRIPDM